MAGTKAGSQAAAQTNKRKYGDDFYARIGALGGKKSRTGGFASYTPCYCRGYAGRHYKQQCAGSKGGSVSKRKRLIALEA